MQPTKGPMDAKNFTATRSPSAHRQSIKIPLKIINDINNQAKYLRETGDANDFAAAGPLLERALSINEKTLRLEHLVVAKSLNTLALYLEDTENLAAAQPLFERALAIYEKALGSEHPVVADCLSNLALYLHSAGNAEDFAVARSLYARALAIIEGCYGPTSAEAGVVLYQLGSLLGELNESDLAETLLRRELDITIEQSGRNSPDTLERIDNLAELFEAKNNLSDMSVLHKGQLVYLKKNRKYGIRRDASLKARFYCFTKQ